MDPRTQDVPGYYVWEVEGQPLTIHLHLEVVDRLGPEIMRGFGAVPKRGAEVGGMLLGTIEPGERIIVHIEDFEPVACDYKRGPSFLLTEGDGAVFEEAWQRWQPDETRPAYAVGYYRSHTREGMSLSPEDLDLLDRYFPDSDQIALLVKPFATKVSMAGFFMRQEGVFPEATPLEFPLRRRELTGVEPPPRKPLQERERERRPPARPGTSDRAPRSRIVAIAPEEPWEEPEPQLPAFATPIPPKSKFRGGWVWLPLSFLFLLLGVLLGFQSAISMGNKNTSAAPADFSLGLVVTRTDDNLTVKWNRDAPAVRRAQKGVLEIEDGGYAKPVDLDQAHLQGGSIIYRNTSRTVHFRLIVNMSGRLTVTESIDWRQ